MVLALTQWPYQLQMWLQDLNVAVFFALHKSLFWNGSNLICWIFINILVKLAEMAVSDVLGLAITHKQWQLVHGTQKMMHQKISHSEKYKTHKNSWNTPAHCIQVSAAFCMLYTGISCFKKNRYLHIMAPARKQEVCQVPLPTPHGGYSSVGGAEHLFIAGNPEELISETGGGPSAKQTLKHKTKRINDITYLCALPLCAAEKLEY